MKLLELIRPYASDKRYSIPIGAGVVFIALFVVFSGGGGEPLPTADVKRGDFLVSIKASGELRAANSFTLTTPRLTWGQMQINFLLPEGTSVKKDDVIVRFATTTIDKTLQDKESELGILRSELAKFRADNVVRISDLEGNLQTMELTYEQAKLQVEKMKFEAEVQRKETEINLKKNRIAYEQAKQKIVSQKLAEKSEEQKQLLKIQQTTNDLTRARQEKEQYTLKASMDGLVVYETNWQTGRKVSVGDSPWPGMSIVSLPDLSAMQSVCQINEVDISKVKASQNAKVKLDAFPDREFTGTVKSVGTIGQQNDRAATVKTFEVVIDIKGADAVLKPGMTTSNEVVMETLADTVYIPLEAVFEKDGKPVVYKMFGSSARLLEIGTGTKNSNYIVVSGGLKGGDKVSLRDPTQKARDGSPQQKSGQGMKL
jgi:RND family efflux transporter MFP subunit